MKTGQFEVVKNNCDIVQVNGDDQYKEEARAFILKGKKDAMVVDDQLSPIKSNKTLRTLRVSIVGVNEVIGLEECLI